MKTVYGVRSFVPVPNAECRTSEHVSWLAHPRPKALIPPDPEPTAPTPGRPDGPTPDPRPPTPTPDSARSVSGFWMVDGGYEPKAQQAVPINCGFMESGPQALSSEDRGFKAFRVSRNWA